MERGVPGLATRQCQIRWDDQGNGGPITLRSATFDGEDLFTTLFDLAGLPLLQFVEGVAHFKGNQHLFSCHAGSVSWWYLAMEHNRLVWFSSLPCMNAFARAAPVVLLYARSCARRARTVPVSPAG